LIASFALASALALSGCTATSAPAVSPTPSATVSTTDAATCTAFGDVLTITGNADAGLRDGRMATQEQQGWYRLATRVLDRVPTSGKGDVSEATAALRDAAPAIGLGAMASSGIGSVDWNDGVDRLSRACADAGAETASSMFTGGEHGFQRADADLTV
jgi:hypothetical protein